MSENDEDGFPDDATTKLVKPKGRAEPFVLVVVDGPSRGKRAPLTKGTAKVGSSSICELVVDDRAVSRIHYEVTATSRGLSLRDLGSTNGTFVAGLGVSLATIPPGALIVAGGTTVRVEGSGDGFALPGVSTGEAFGGLFGKSVAMRQVFAILERAAPSDATVLLRGETGTGKEVAARAIHDASPRARGPFVAVDCGAIPEALFESELFGHARGAFTGASSERAGVFEEAHQGTLFLDEIGELPLALQAKLLRALETRTIRRVGTNVERSVDVRVVAATHRPLEQAVNGGTFREDLYYRLAVVEVLLPPLRERPADIAELADRFHKARGGQGPLPPEFLASLARRSFPGNVRELKHAVERALLLGNLSTETEPAPAPALRSMEDLEALRLPLKEARDAWTEQFELLYVKGILERTGGNVTHAAELAGVNRRFLQRMMARLGVRGSE